MRGWHIVAGVAAALVVGGGLWWALRPPGGSGGPGADAVEANASQPEARQERLDDGQGQGQAQKVGEFFSSIVTALGGAALGGSAGGAVGR